MSESDQCVDMPGNTEAVVTGGKLPGDVHENQTHSNCGNGHKDPKPCIFNHKWLLLIFWGIGLLLYPLLAYTFAIVGDEIKCVRMDKSIGITLYVLLAVLEMLNIVLYKIYEMPNDLQRNEVGMLHVCWLSIKAFSLFPLSLVMIILFHTENLSTLLSGGAVKALIFFLPKLLRLFTLSTNAISPSSTFSGWAIKFIFSYLLMAQGLGAYWFLLALFTEGKCWQKACGNNNGGCRDGANILYSCKESSEVYEFVTGLCSRNTTMYDFGVFRDAHQSGILEKRGPAVTRILYCFRWALQNVSGFGQKLEAGTQVSGNLFVIFTIFIAMALFFFSMGQMQVYLHSDFLRLKRRGKKLKETKLSTPFNRLPKSLRNQVLMYKRNPGGETRGDNIESIFCNLPQNLRKEITQELSLEILREVAEFGRWDEESLKNLCACLKPTFYVEHTHIIRENDPVDRMIFVVQGKLWTYSSSPKDDSTNDSSAKVLFYGEELVDRLWTNPYTSTLPASERNIQAVTDVDAFVLMAYDLKRLLIERGHTPIAAQGADAGSKRETPQR